MARMASRGGRSDARPPDAVTIVTIHVCPLAVSNPAVFIGSPGARITASRLPARVGFVSGGTAKERPGFEQARDELTELVKRLEAGGLTLEQSLQLWERGEQLATICEEWLEGARARMATALARQEEEAGDSAEAPF